MTAKDIKKLLAKRHRYDVFVPECKDGPTMWNNQGDPGHRRMDAWAMKKSYTQPRAICYEIKVSRVDFLRDDKWHHYLPYCNEFYFVCPPDLIDKSELPEGTGLIYTSKKGTSLVTKKKALWRDVRIPESLYKYILFSRADIIDGMGNHGVV